MVEGTVAEMASEVFLLHGPTRDLTVTKGGSRNGALVSLGKMSGRGPQMEFLYNY